VTTSRVSRSSRSGASAGGLAALSRFFEAMPADAGFGFVVIVHLAPTHASHLPELLARHTAMPVTQVQDNRARAGSSAIMST
jgi:two-component system CheB/CheR fusion protein